MPKRLSPVIAVLAFGLLFAACQDDGPTVASTDADAIDDVATKDGDDHQEYLSELWNNDKNYAFETVIEARFHPANGCDVAAVPDSWREHYPEYAFRLEVARDAIQLQENREVTITIAVPQLLAIEPSNEWPQVMPIHYEVDFVGHLDPPARLTLAFHPHLKPNCRGYCFFGLSNEDGWYTVVDPTWVAPLVHPAKLDEPQDIIDDPTVECATGLLVEITDFTLDKPDRWELSNGCCDRNATPCDWVDGP